MFTDSKHGICILGKRVSDNNFLEHANRKNSQAYSNIFLADAVGFCLGELWHHLFMMQYRAGNQMWKVCDKKQVMNRVAFLDYAFVAVCQIGDLCKGEK